MTCKCFSGYFIIVFKNGFSQLRYIRRYVTVLREEYRMNFADADDNFLQTNPLFDEDHIVKEVEAFTLASHFFWSLWAIVNAQVSRIPFGYWVGRNVFV